MPDLRRDVGRPCAGRSDDQRAHPRCASARRHLARGRRWAASRCVRLRRAYAHLRVEDRLGRVRHSRRSGAAHGLGRLGRGLGAFPGGRRAHTAVRRHRHRPRLHSHRRLPAHGVPAQPPLHPGLLYRRRPSARPAAFRVAACCGHRAHLHGHCGSCSDRGGQRVYPGRNGGAHDGVCRGGRVVHRVRVYDAGAVERRQLQRRARTDHRRERRGEAHRELRCRGPARDVHRRADLLAARRAGGDR